MRDAHVVSHYIAQMHSSPINLKVQECMYSGTMLGASLDKFGLFSKIICIKIVPSSIFKFVTKV